MKGILPLHLKVCLNLLDGAFGKVLQPSEVNPIVLNSSFILLPHNTPFLFVNHKSVLCDYESFSSF